MESVIKKFNFPHQRVQGGRRGLRRLSGVHHEIKRRLFLGEKNKDIAAEVGIAPATVSIVKNSTLMQEQLAAMHGLVDVHFMKVAKRIRNKADECLDLLEKAIEGDIDGERIPIATRLKQANIMLDRAGFVSMRDSQNFGGFSLEDIEVLKQRAVEMKQKDNSNVYEHVGEGSGDGKNLCPAD